MTQNNCSDGPFPLLFILSLSLSLSLSLCPSLSPSSLSDTDGCSAPPSRNNRKCQCFKSASNYLSAKKCRPTLQNAKHQMMSAKHVTDLNFTQYLATLLSLSSFSLSPYSFSSLSLSFLLSLSPHSFSLLLYSLSLISLSYPTLSLLSLSLSLYNVLQAQQCFSSRIQLLQQETFLRHPDRSSSGIDRAAVDERKEKATEKALIE
jgi:hypothetical protein